MSTRADKILNNPVIKDEAKPGIPRTITVGSSFSNTNGDLFVILGIDINGLHLGKQDVGLTYKVSFMKDGKKKTIKEKNSAIAFRNTYFK